VIFLSDEIPHAGQSYTLARKAPKALTTQLIYMGFRWMAFFLLCRNPIFKTSTFKNISSNPINFKESHND
jgi:hypothetical protein